jgi:hypothetical protein
LKVDKVRPPQKFQPNRSVHARARKRARAARF